MYPWARCLRILGLNFQAFLFALSFIVEKMLHALEEVAGVLWRCEKEALSFARVRLLFGTVVMSWFEKILYGFPSFK